jgi:uncharacterized protein
MFNLLYQPGSAVCRWSATCTGSVGHGLLVIVLSPAWRIVYVKNQHGVKPLAVVTGASSGIGYELARQFAQHDFDLLVAAEDADIHQAARMFETDGAQVTAVQVDLASYDGVEQLFAAIQAAGRPVEAIAINAGVGVGGAFITETALDDELNMINLNITSTVHLAKRVLPTMVARGSGKVLFTSSIAALMPGPFYAVYAASKSFVQSFAEALRNELKDTGVTITALQPGATDTEFFARADMEDTKAGAGSKMDPADVAREGFAALMAGKDHVVTGAMNKVQAVMSKVMTDEQKAEIHRKQTEPGSA